ncbi:nuclear transport factor 2 family protein [Nakamurella sp. GG22]
MLAAADRLIAAFAATDTTGYFESFAPDASFVFYPEAVRFNDRSAYERVWKTWLADGWRVVSCDSTERLVQIFDRTAVFTHRVRTVTAVGDDESVTDERETIVFVSDGRQLRAVHEHLSPVPQ